MVRAIRGEDGVGWGLVVKEVGSRREWERKSLRRCRGSYSLLLIPGCGLTGESNNLARGCRFELPVCVRHGEALFQLSDLSCFF